MSATPPWEIYSDAAALELLGGNVDALRFVLDIARLAHVYDDLIDQDTPVGEQRVHDLMWTLLVTLPTNPFYRTHQETLRPILVSGVLNWKAATDMEQHGSREELRIAHALRYAIADVFLMCMVITMGREYAMKNARRARLLGQNDTWAHYASEHDPKGAA